MFRPIKAIWIALAILSSLFAGASGELWRTARAHTSRVPTVRTTRLPAVDADHACEWEAAADVHIQDPGHGTGHSSFDSRRSIPSIVRFDVFLGLVAAPPPVKLADASYCLYTGRAPPAV